MPRARSQAWRAVISTAVPASKAPCWVHRFSAGGSRAAGPRARRATAPVLPESRTGIELNDTRLGRVLHETQHCASRQGVGSRASARPNLRTQRGLLFNVAHRCFRDEPAAAARQCLLPGLRPVTGNGALRITIPSLRPVAERIAVPR